MNGRETFVFEVRQLVEVGANSRDHAVEMLKLYPPVRSYAGYGFSIRTRNDIEVCDVRGKEDLQEM